jgi:hypothetical protein
MRRSQALLASPAKGTVGVQNDDFADAIAHSFERSTISATKRRPPSDVAWNALI